jgi:hypothetical protein
MWGLMIYDLRLMIVEGARAIRREILFGSVRFSWLMVVLWLIAGPVRAAADSSGVVDYRGIHIDKGKGTVTFPAEINMQTGMLEYLLVADTGKTHESLLSTKIEPYDIQVAMLLLGVAPAGKSDSAPPGQITRDYLKTAPELKGDKVNVLLTWAGHRARAEDLVWNLDKNAVMTPGPWIYNGSEMYDGRFLAQVDGSVAALVRDSGALMNNPRPGNDDDQIWEVNAAVTPAVGTAVDVTIQLEDSTGK